MLYFTIFLSAILSVVALPNDAHLYNRQVTSAPFISSSSIPLPSGSTLTTITQSIFPGGVASGSTSLESTFPNVCIDGCWNVAGPYFFCFINNTTPGGAQINPDTCFLQFCNQTLYDQMVGCLNCIVANGGERPTGYTNNTSLTAAPSRNPNSITPYNPMGLIDLNQGNGWLKNISDKCIGANKAVMGATTISAIPTTTGPYKTSWTSGQTISRPVWTGLSQYPAPVATYTATVPIDLVNGSRTAGAGVSGSTSRGSGSAASGAAASQSSRAAGQRAVGTEASGWIFGGLILAWAMA